MAFSFTGFAYLLLFFALGFLTYRLFQYWQKSKDTTSKFFLYFAISLTLFALVRTISGLFFANNTQILIKSIIFVSFIEGLAAAIVAYLIIHLKFSKISPWLGFSVIFLLGLVATILTIIIAPQFKPFLESSGAINWGFLPLATNLHYFILRLGIILITFIPLIIILFQQFRTSDDFYIRIRSLGLSVLLFLGIVIGLLDFFLTELLNLEVIHRDIVACFLSIFLFVIIYLTQKPPVVEKPKKEYIPSPKIPW